MSKSCCPVCFTDAAEDEGGVGDICPVCDWEHDMPESCDVENHLEHGGEPCRWMPCGWSAANHATLREFRGAYVRTLSFEERKERAIRCVLRRVYGP